MNTQQRKRFDDEERRKIVPDGHRILVPIMAMDSVQKQFSGQPAVDERVRRNIARNEETLSNVRRDADRVQAYADHFTAQQKARDAAQSGPYADYVTRLNSSWRKSG